MSIPFHSSSGTIRGQENICFPFPNSTPCHFNLCRVHSLCKISSFAGCTWTGLTSGQCSMLETVTWHQTWRLGILVKAPVPPHPLHVSHGLVHLAQAAWQRADTGCYSRSWGLLRMAGIKVLAGLGLGWGPTSWAVPLSHCAHTWPFLCAWAWRKWEICFLSSQRH